MNWITSSFKTKISIYNDGTNYWLSPIDFESSCNFHVQNFPFDEQLCSITFGPWSDDVSKISLHEVNNPIVTNQYTENGEWLIDHVSQRVQLSYYKCCPRPFSDLKINLVLKRKPSFYVVNSIVPALFLIVLIIVGHRLPPQCGERITLTIMICLTSIVMMEYTNSKVLPQTPHVSLLGKIFLILTILSSCSIMQTCLILSLNQRPEQILNWLPSSIKQAILAKSQNSDKKNSDSVKEYENNEYDLLCDKHFKIYDEVKKFNTKTEEKNEKKLLTIRLQIFIKYLDYVFIFVVFVSTLITFIIETKNNLS